MQRMLQKSAEINILELLKSQKKNFLYSLCDYFIYTFHLKNAQGKVSSLQ